MNINNIEKEFRNNPLLLKKGRKIYENGKVHFSMAEENFQNSIFYFEVNDKYINYTSEILVDKDGDVIPIYCPCPSFMICHHLIAALFYFRENHRSVETFLLEKPIKEMIDLFDNMRISESINSNSDDEEMHIIPIVETDGFGLFVHFKIGGKRLYVVRNIIDLAQHFYEKERFKYGKNYIPIHDAEKLDNTSKKLLDFIYKAIGMNCVHSHSLNKLCLENELIGYYLNNFSHENTIEIDGTIFSIKHENPEMYAVLSQLNDYWKFSFNEINDLIYIESKNNAYFINSKNNTLYCCTQEFTDFVIPPYRLAIAHNNTIEIKKDNIQQFYNSVLLPLSKYIDIHGLLLFSSLTYPSVTPRLYLDMLDNTTVTGDLRFYYGEEFHHAFEENSELSLDKISEISAQTAVSKWFETESIMSAQGNYTGLTLSGNDKIYCLLTEGLPMLEGKIEIYASDAFNKIKIHAPASPVVGIRPENNLLAIDLSSYSYTLEELAEVLNAYKKGKSYHRLSSGAFVSLNDQGIRELSELKENLNISDKEFLKNNIKVPAYRMLYLDSIISDKKGMRLSRSTEFKKAIEKYKNIDDHGKDDLAANISSIMRDYQVYGFSWMKTIYDYGFGGILADDMGLGKTLQSISLIDCIKAKIGNEFKALVVCPSSLIINWKNEMERFAPDLKPLVIAGTASSRSEMLAQTDDFDVIVTSYQTLVRDIAQYENIHFELQFIDEAQYIKNHSTQIAKTVKAIDSHVRFALTGTPIENSLAELWSIFDFIMPGYLFAYNHFKKNFETPIVKKNDEKAAIALQKNVSPFILRRMKTEVLSELPEKTETLMYAEMDDVQNKLYLANMALVQKEIASSDSGSKIEILAMLTKLRQICCDPSLLFDNYTGGSAKLEMCLELIQNCISSGHKLLLFSQFTSMLDIIKSKLDELGIEYYTLTGSTSAHERIRLTNSFNKNTIPVFLISLKAGGTGLNLTGADIVIHYDPWWNASAENQASDRVHRIGQQNKVQIYKLITKNTIEERIQELQQKKLTLVDMALSGKENIIQMSSEDILSILG